MTNVSASEFFPGHLRAHLAKSPVKQTPKPEMTGEQTNNIADFLLKSTVFINKAYAALLPKSAEVANQLAKVSNDILKIYSRLFEIDLESVSADEDGPSEPTTPAFPPGLFSNAEEAKARAEMHKRSYLHGLAAEDALAESPNTSSYYLEPEPGSETVADIFKRAWGPWSEARLVDLLALQRSAAFELANSFARLSSQMKQWDKDLQSTPIPPMRQIHEDSKLMPVTPESSKTASARPANTDPAPARAAVTSKEPVSTWAKVAAIPSRQGSGDKPGPTINLVTSMSDFKESTVPPAMSKPNVHEAMEKQARIVFVRACSKTTKLRDITKHITEGPLMSILIEKEPSYPPLSACIIFMDAAHAIEFVQKNGAATNINRHSLYGSGTQVVGGGPWPEDDEIRAMTSRRERRRLTFSAGGLFQRVSRDTFKADIYAIAGEASVELIWLFNTGNATVVFASVRVARAVKTRFMTQTSGSKLYEGLRISYSSDPCEKELHLVTQMMSGPERTMATTVKRG
ncbi:hypothetical protein MMC30_006061 [Trapelia coarctata]|nr:hypothetical protein [Trapelia coarctata]